ncbi:hypothetical protein AMEX_G15451 [Astyanax mexicanus]|uniref:Uncharacterized protein n=1 Tax=Astyanax mexicanus TaxID=7994 RepID=A0A8T2LI20_ASTMX|nr:hypothetical protein AMEX_G15451 [Astyanax mexicanus]
MNEQPTEDTPSLQQLDNEERSTGDGEGEEKAEDMMDLKDMINTWENEKKYGQMECQESISKVEIKPAKVQSVFSLVRSQIRAQSGLDGRRSGMLQLVHRVTRQLERSKGDYCGTVPSLEITSGEEEDTADLKTEEETIEVNEDPETEKKNKEEMYVVLLQEVLDSLESLRKEVREELSLLKLESQNYTEQSLKSMEARLTHTLTTHMMPQPFSRSHLMGSLDGKKHKPLPVPPLVATRRRTLNRTMTTITPKTCPPPSLGPRSMSEPLRGRETEGACAGGSNCSTHTLLRGRDSLRLPLGPLGPLPPGLSPTQPGKKPTRSKTRTSKAEV